MTNTALIKEVFASIQGEGPYIGQKQIFVRFCGCNLHCAYCDTDFRAEKKFFVHGLEKEFENPISSQSFAEIVNSFNAETVSLTGGEPLLHKDFLLEFLPKLNQKKVYLETNGVLPNEFKAVIGLIDVVSMDIKLPCSTMQKAEFEANREFIKIAYNNSKEIFAKIVLNKNYAKDEIIAAINVLKEFDTPLILQPMDCKEKVNELDKNSLIELFDFALACYPQTRLIPQVHKFLNLL